MLLISCRYSQVPGIDFLENYSLEVNDITFHVILVMLHFDYFAKKVNVETTFLYRDLDEEIYVEGPQGTTHVKRMSASF